MSWVVPIPERSRADWEAFHAVLKIAGTVPCTDRLAWISESADDRSYAAGHCRGCPIIAECGTAATAIGMKVGVWGGRDRTPLKRPPQTLSLFEADQRSSA